MAELKLTNVHEALSLATVSTHPENKLLACASFRLDTDVKEQAAQICSRHGVTISDFLRECANGLVRDYAGMSKA